MKKYILVLIGILLATCTYAQKWQNLISYPGASTFRRNIEQHYDHGYLIAGNLDEGYDNTHGWLVKTDINGEVLWNKQIGLLPDQTLITKTLFDEEGNIYVFGWLYNQNFAHEFPLILKLNACGEKIWCRLFALDGYSFGWFQDAIFMENGDLLCMAIMPEDDPSNNNRILLFRVSSEGDFLGHKGYATHEDHPYYGDPIGQSLNQFGDQYIISGNVYSPYPNDPNPYHVWQRPMFIGINENFEEEWILEFGITDSLPGRAESVIPINDTLLMGVGRYRHNDESGNLTASPWLMLFNNSGEQVGYKIIDYEQFEPGVLGSAFYEIEHIEDYKYLVSSDYRYNEENNYDAGEVVVDTSGNVYYHAIRENTYGSRSNLAKTFDAKYIICNDYSFPGFIYNIFLYKITANLEQDTIYPATYSYDSLCTKIPIQSGIIDLSDCYAITSIDEAPTLEQYNTKLQSIAIAASPNPTSTGEVLLQYTNTKSFTKLQLHVSNIYGKQIHTEAILPYQEATRLDTSHWPAGMYIATIMSNGQMRGKCKILVE